MNMGRHRYSFHPACKRDNPRISNPLGTLIHSIAVSSTELSITQVKTHLDPLNLVRTAHPLQDMVPLDQILVLRQSTILH